MLKLKQVLRIGGVIVLLTIHPLLWGYDQLTDQEIIDYWNTLTLDQKIQEIRKLDLLEHTSPEFESFNFLALLTKKNILIIYPEQSIIEMKHAYLTYDIELPTFHIENFIVPPQKKWFLAGIGGGVIAIVGTIITGEEKWWKYIISGIGGISLGLLTEYLFR